ncbi:MAG TPA: alpha/beta hydrolase-fold protein [Candidatus Krumholzibacteria bacterium]|nr:alpha/beta hydrolase-fold protein [Candidatus Krumholzibacteria bacterium]
MAARARTRQTITPPCGTVLRIRFDSRVLRGNRLGDPSVREVPIYLPPGYESSTRRYPVLFALAGFAGGGRSWLNTAAWGEALDQRLDRLHATGAMAASIVVMPDCFTRWGGSQYRNSTATGRYADHLIHELVPWVDRELRTLGGRDHRGIFGKSSGGYGALVLAMQHPDVFGGVACHSGDMGFEYCYFPDFTKFLRQVHESGGVARFVRDFEAARRRTQAQFDAMNILAMSACYSPRPGAPLGIAWPVDLATGEPDRRVWERWLRSDPLRMLSQHAGALRRLRFLFLDCGTRDEFGLLWGARRMHAELRRRRIRHVYEEFGDGHMNTSYRLERSLPRLSRALRKAPPLK